MKGVEDHSKAVLFLQVRVPPAVGDRQRTWFGVVTDDSDVEHLSVESDPYLGPLTRGLALKGLYLHEPSCHLYVRPNCLGQDFPVHRGRRRHPRCAQLRPRGLLRMHGAEQQHQLK